jgi:hypothetical protein
MAAETDSLRALVRRQRFYREAPAVAESTLAFVLRRGVPVEDPGSVVWARLLREAQLLSMEGHPHAMVDARSLLLAGYHVALTYRLDGAQWTAACLRFVDAVLARWSEELG